MKLSSRRLVNIVGIIAFSLAAAAIVARISKRAGGFGTGGVVENRAGVSAKAVLRQRDGKVVVVGFGFGPQFDVVLARFSPKGEPDPTFGDKGVVRLDFGGDEQPAAAALTHDQKIVVGLTVSLRDGATTMAVARFLPTGNLDTEFGNGGLARLALGGPAVLQGLQLDLSYRPTLAGSVERSGRRQFVVARLTPEGAPDSDFGSNGAVVLSAGEGHAEAHAIAVMPDRAIVIAGYVTEEARARMAVARFTQHGKLDPTFGVRSWALGESASYAYAVKPIGADLIVGGIAGTRENYDFAMARVRPDGRLETKFGNEGILLLPIGTADETIHALLVTPKEEIVAIGSVAAGESPNTLAMARFTGFGAPVKGFGRNGISHWGGVNYIPYAAQLAPDGKILVAGSRLELTVGNTAMFVARFLANGAPDEP